MTRLRTPAGRPIESEGAGRAHDVSGRGRGAYPDLVRDPDEGHRISDQTVSGFALTPNPMAVVQNRETSHIAG